MIYCGIGTRSITDKTSKMLIEIAEIMATRKHILRSGGADGCDAAFERGCDNAKGEKVIFLPWKQFNGNESKIFTPADEAYEIAARYHPAWHVLTTGGRKLHARNVHQVLGIDLETPAHLILCWTPNASATGGTGEAIRIATDYQIPIIDLGKKEVWNIRDVLDMIDKIEE